MPPGASVTRHSTGLERRRATSPGGSPSDRFGSAGTTKNATRRTDCTPHHHQPRVAPIAAPDALRPHRACPSAANGGDATQHERTLRPQGEVVARRCEGRTSVNGVVRAGCRQRNLST